MTTKYFSFCSCFQNLARLPKYLALQKWQLLNLVYRLHWSGQLGSRKKWRVVLTKYTPHCSRLNYRRRILCRWLEDDLNRHTHLIFCRPRRGKHCFLTVKLWRILKHHLQIFLIRPFSRCLNDALTLLQFRKQFFSPHLNAWLKTRT